MKILHTYHHREERIEIVSSLAGKHRAKALGLFAVCAAWTIIMSRIDPKASATWVPSTLAFLALAIALGRSVYLIKPGSHVRFQLRVLGIPVLSKFIDAATFHSIGIIGEDGGAVDLRFVNAAGQPVLTIEGFPDLESAGQVAALFQLDEGHRKKATDNLIDRAVVAERKYSPWLGWVFVGVAFGLSPAVAWLFREGMDGLWNHLVAGFFLVLIATYVTDRDQGIIAVSKDGGYIDRWERSRPFQRIEYRQHLTGGPEVSLLRIRFDSRYLIVALLLLGQVATIYLIIRRHEAAENARPIEARDITERANDEDVRKGAEKFQELRKQRQTRGDGQQTK